MKPTTIDADGPMMMLIVAVIILLVAFVVMFFNLIESKEQTIRLAEHLQWRVDRDKELAQIAKVKFQKLLSIYASMMNRIDGKILVMEEWEDFDRKEREALAQCQSDEIDNLIQTVNGLLDKVKVKPVRRPL
jgi:hypothetical protein